MQLMEEVVMSVACRLLFGVRTIGSTRLRVESQPKDPAPPLLIRTRDPQTDTGSEPDKEIGFLDGAWSAELGAGDHVIRIDLPENLAGWFDDKVTFTLEPGAVCVRYNGKQADPRSEERTVAWEAGSGYAGDSSLKPALGSDPKDPWPPPGELVSLPDRTWFTAQLYDLWINVSNGRSGLWGDYPPPRHA